MHCWEDCTGGIYAAPTNQPVSFSFSFGRGQGIPRPYRAMVFYCPVGRGDPTPPYGEFGGNRKAARRGQDPSLRTAGRQAKMGRIQISGRFVGDA